MNKKVNKPSTQDRDKALFCQSILGFRTQRVFIHSANQSLAINIAERPLQKSEPSNKTNGQL